MDNNPAIPHDFQILVTGANGFIGFDLVQTLLQRGNKVVGLHSSHPRLELLEQKENYSYHTWSEDLSFLKDGRWIVFHFAALSNFLHSDLKELENVNVNLTKRLVESLDTQRSLVVYSSSIGVYDRGLFESSKRPLTLVSSKKPKSLYGKTKLAGELAIISSGISYVILRLAWVYGKEMKATSHLRAFFHWSKESKFITRLPWTGKVSVINIKDITAYCLDILKENRNYGKRSLIVNLHESTPISISRVMEYGATSKPLLFLRAMFSILSTWSRIFPSKLRILLEPYLVFTDESAKFESQFELEFKKIVKEWQAER